MKKFIFLGVLMLSACTPIAVALPTTTPTKPPSFTPSHTETPTPIPLSTSTLTPTLESISGGWSIFHSSEYGFSFQYPSVYDEGFKSKTDPQAFCNIQTDQSDDGIFNIWVGNIWITVKKTDQKPDDFSNAHVKEMSINWNTSSIIQTTLGEVPAIILEYTHPTRHAQGVQAFVVHNKNLIFLNYYEPSVYIDCAPPDTGYSDYWVYEQIIKTWKFE